MLSFLAIDTSPKWLLVFFVCSGEPALIKDPKNDINCKKLNSKLTVLNIVKILRHW